MYYIVIMPQLNNRIAGVGLSGPRSIQWRNTLERFGLRAQLLHALLALAMIFMLILGLTMEDWPKAWRGFAFMLHKGLGVWILFLSLVWIGHYVWQLTPEALPTQPRPEYRIAKLVHKILLLLCVVMPLSGWVMVSAWGSKPVSIAPGLTIPMIVGKDPAFAHAMQGVHITLAWVLIGVIALHAIGAFFHHLIRRDPILKRMIPRFRPPAGYYRFQFDKAMRESRASHK